MMWQPMIEDKIAELLGSLKGIKGTFVVRIDYDNIEVEEVENGNTSIDNR